jgi:hypothetical protein
MAARPEERINRRLARPGRVDSFANIGNVTP